MSLYIIGMVFFYIIQFDVVFYIIQFQCFRPFFDDAFFMRIENHFLQYDTYRYYTILYRLFYI